MKLKNYSTFKISGLNYEQLLNKLTKYNISANNIKRHNNELFLTVEDKNVKKLIALMGSSCYNITKVRTFGIKSVLNTLKLRLGIVIGLIFSLTLMFVNSNFISSIHIEGLERINNTEIVNFLAQNNVKVNSLKNNINTKKLELDLLSNFDNLSIASVAIKGTTLEVNLKEKIFVDILDGEAEDIVAPYNCQITSLTVTQGTALYNVGDSVKQGDVIVAGYRLNENNQKEPIKAVAKIELNCFISSRLEVGSHTTQVVRTGKSKVENSYYFNNTVLYNFKPVSPYEIYETKIERIKMFSFLPFYMQKCTYYECKEEKIAVDFERDVEMLKKQLQYSTYEKLTETDEILNEEFYITKQNEINIIVFTITIKKIIN